MNWNKVTSFFKTKPVNNIKESNEPKMVESKTPQVPTMGILNGQAFASKLDAYSPTWIFVRDHLIGHLKDLRQKNDNPLLTIEKTQAIRGQIKEIKLLIDILYEKKKSKYIEPEA